MNRFLQALGNTRVYALTDRRISGLTHPRQVAVLSSSGARIIQLREKELSAREFYSQAADAIDAARQCGVHLIINDRVDIALALKADGVHLGQDDLPVEAARRILGPEAIVGVSTHNLKQIQRASQMPVDYVAFGPIFPTSTKKSSNLPLGIPAVREAGKFLGEMPLVAIGGITGLNGKAVLDAGAAAVALIADCWKSEENSPEIGSNLFQL